MRLKKTVIAVLISATLLGGVGIAIAHSHFDHDRHQQPRIAQDLDDLHLSKQQEAQIGQLLSDWKSQHEQLQQAHETQRLILLKATEFDPQAAELLVQDKRHYQRDREIDTLMLQHSIYQLLDEQQRLDFEQELAEHKGKRHRDR